MNTPQQKPQLSLEEQDIKVLLPKIILPDQPQEIKETELPNDYFEMTKKDMQNAVTSMQKQNKKPDHFISRSYVEEQRLKRNMKLKKTTVKVKFPDGMELIRCFHPLETGLDLYQFVDKSLRQHWHFILETNAGHQLIPSDNTTFAQMNYFPGVVLLIVFKNKNDVEKPYLNEEMMSIAQHK